MINAYGCAGPSRAISGEWGATGNSVDIVDITFLLAMINAYGCAGPSGAISGEWGATSNPVDIVGTPLGEFDTNVCAGPSSGVGRICNINSGIGPGTGPRWVQESTDSVDIVDFTGHGHGQRCEGS